MPSEMDRLSLFSFIFSSLTSVSGQEVQSCFSDTPNLACLLHMQKENTQTNVRRLATSHFHYLCHWEAGLLFSVFRKFSWGEHCVNRCAQ